MYDECVNFTLGEILLLWPVHISFLSNIFLRLLCFRFLLFKVNFNNIVKITAGLQAPE